MVKEGIEFCELDIDLSCSPLVFEHNALGYQTRVAGHTAGHIGSAISQFAIRLLPFVFARIDFLVAFLMLHDHYCKEK